MNDAPGAKQLLRVVAAVLFLWVLACSTSPSRENGSGGNGGPSQEPRFLDLPAIEARTADDPPGTAVLLLALGFYRESVGAEIVRNRVSVAEAVRVAVSSSRAMELNSVEGYERLREKIITRLNAVLVSGRVERIIIRNVSVR